MLHKLKTDLKIMEYVVDICHFGYYLFIFCRSLQKFFFRTLNAKSFQLYRPDSLSHNYQLCHWSRKAAINNIYMNRCSSVPIKFIYKERQWSGFGHGPQVANPCI